MNIRIIDCGSKKVPAIVEQVKNLSVHVDVCKMENISNENADGFIISGAPILLTETYANKYLSLIQPVIHSGKPVLGICFGHQLIGLAFGAKIQRCEEDRNNQKINFRRSTRLGEKLKGDLIFNEDHCECISLPVNFKQIASSVVCENEMMEHENLPLIGVQFHPETSAENGHLIFEGFINYCKNYI